MPWTSDNGGRLGLNKDVKIKVIYGTFPTTEDDFTIDHDLPSTATVIGLSVGAEYADVGGASSSTTQFMPPGFTDSGNFEYYTYVNVSSITIRQTSCINLQGRPLKAIVWYLE